MSQALLLANALVGSVLPAVIAVVNRRQWTPRTKSIVAFAVCAAAAAVTCVYAGDVTLADWGAGVLTVFTTARATYAGLWHPTGAAHAIEQATSPAPPPTRAEVKAALKAAATKPTDTAPTGNDA